jgi:hypothetical protein
MKITVLPRNRIRASAYPAIIDNARLMTVWPIEISRLFLKYVRNGAACIAST